MKWDDFKTSFPPNMVQTLANDTPFHNLPNGGIILNHTPVSQDPKIMKLSKDLRNICTDLIPFFDLSTAKGRKLSSVSFGWTDNDPNQ